MDATQPAKTISARELREILFMVREGTTVEELRSELFKVEPHDEQHPINLNLIQKLAPAVYG